MFKIKEYIFSLFTAWDTREDVNKDSEKKGTLQRYNETLGEQWDDDILPLVNNLIDNTLVPKTMLPKFIPYLESMVGLDNIVTDLDVRKALLQNIIRIYTVKGTKRSYEILFKLLGFDSVEIIEEDISFGFDSPVILDDPTRIFDNGSSCFRCGFYTLNLTGTAAFTSDLRSTIFKAIKLVEPIHARLLEVTYNGDSIDIITIFVAENGDLIYETVNDIRLLLDERGDLFINGSSATKYSIDSNGNMIYD